MPKKIKIGLFGVGHLGKIHAKLLNEITGFELVGFFDPDAAKAVEVEKMGLKRFESASDLIAACDAADVVLLCL